MCCSDIEKKNNSMWLLCDVFVMYVLWNVFHHDANIMSVTCCLSSTVTGLLECAVTHLCLIYDEWSRLIWLAKCSPPSPLCVVLTRAVCCASRREDEGEQPGVPAWLRGRLDWIRRLTAGPHLWRRRAERPPVCLPVHQVSIWVWRKDGVSQRVSKWAKWGHQ